MESPGSPQRLHIRILYRCFVCLEDLPQRYDDCIPVESAEWEHSMVSLFPHENADGSVRILLRSTDDIQQDEPYYYARSSIQEREGPARPVTFCYFEGHSGLYCGECQADQVMFLAHRCCWKAINHPRIVPSFQLLKLAQHTRPIAPPQRRGGTQRLRRLSRETQLDAFDKTTVLGSFLGQVVRRLPLELQCNILDYLEGSLFASVLKAKTAATALLGRLGPDKCVKPRIVHLGKVEVVTSLHANSSNIRGRQFLTSLAFNQPRCDLQIAVRSTKIWGLQYALGEFGLCGVRILYADESRSPWLGDPTSCWLGTTMGGDLQMLYALADDIRLIQLGFKDPVQDRPPIESGGADNSRSVLLDHDFPHVGRYHNFLQTYSAMPTIPYYPRHRPCYYLPLSNGSEYTSGLTVYVFNKGNGLEITGIASHGPSSQLVGQRSNCAIHMALSPGEYITSLWMHISCGCRRVVRRDCFLSVSTSRGRVQHFGAYFASQRRTRDTSRQWVRVSKGHRSKVTGIIVDAMTYEIEKNISDVGVTEECEHQEPPLTENHPLALARHGFPTISIKWSHPYRTIMHSMAKLDDICNLQVRKAGPRCLGLRIVHGDGTIEILGQWDPLDPASISTIYDISEGTLAGLSFQTTPTSRCDRYMSEITPIMQTRPVTHQPTTSPLRQEFLCDGNGQRLSWWFTLQLDAVSLYKVKGVSQMESRSDIFASSLLRY